MGATERAALDRLVREFGAEVKIQYDAQRTRLHAKAWLFRRNTGFDTAYVGSSNLSRAALLDGVEWNVRLSRVGTPTLLEKFTATFDTYWNDTTFETYDPDRDAIGSTTRCRGVGSDVGTTASTISLSGLEVRPYPYQQEMLEALDAERTVHDRHRNLVVAATGTGKTVIAALDYRSLCDRTTRDDLRLLFVAHRQEILEQSLRTYREVLGDGDFGELYVGGARPERWRHVFASRPVPDVLRRREHPGRRLRHRRHRRVPPRRGADLPSASSITSSRKNCSASPRRPNAPTASTSGPSSTAAPPRSSGSGTRWSATCCARSTTSGSPTTPTCAGPVEARRLRRARAVERLHRQRRSGRDRPQAAARQGHSTSVACGRWASASASRTPSSWPALQRGRDPGARGERHDTPDERDERPARPARPAT